MDKTVIDKIRNWEPTDFHGLMYYIQERWQWADYFRIDGNVAQVSTGGWSDNEAMLDAIPGMWAYAHWYKKMRGGHYVFARNGKGSEIMKTYRCVTDDNISYVDAPDTDTALSSVGPRAVVFALPVSNTWIIDDHNDGATLDDWHGFEVGYIVLPVGDGRYGCWAVGTELEIEAAIEAMFDSGEETARVWYGRWDDDPVADDHKFVLRKVVG